METKDWPDFTRGLSAELRNLRGGAPEVMKAFSRWLRARWLKERWMARRRN